VSWIIGTNASTEHPPYLPAAGATVIHELLEALASNPKVFSKSVFFLNCTWRRQTCGDLTAALNLKSSREVSFPALPYNYLLNQYVNSQDQNPPVVPKNQTLPTQEPGTRPPVP
jgi:phospholipase C